MANTVLPPSVSPVPESSGFTQKLMLTLVGLLIVGGVGAYAYMNFGGTSVAKLDKNSPPPSLQVAGGAKGSFVETTQGTLQFETADTTAYAANLAGLKSKYTLAGSAKSGINYLFADQDITMADVVKGIDPVANRLLLAYYDKGFYTYPKGPFTGTTEIKAGDLATFKIPKNRVVIVITDKETTSYGLRSPTDKPTDTLATAPMADSDSGWVLVASKPTKLADLIAPFGARVVSAWALKGQNDFGSAPVDLSTFAFSTYSIAWLQLGQKTAVDNGGSNNVNKPTITSVSPSSLIQGQKAATITITGTNLLASKLDFSPAADFTYVGAASVNATGTAITLTVDVSDTAVQGPVAITATTVNGVATNSTLAIVQKGSIAPIISSVSPASLTQGDSDKEITITGKNLVGATVTSAQDMTITSQSVATDTTLKFKVNIAANAPTGAKAIKVTKGSDSVVDSSFMVNAPADTKPVITSLTPSVVYNTGDYSTPFTITGSNLKGANAYFANNSIGDDVVSFGFLDSAASDDTKLVGKIFVGKKATAGFKVLTVKNTAGITTNASLEVKVNAPADQSPVITGVTPNTATAGTDNLVVTISGTNLDTACTADDLVFDDAAMYDYHNQCNQTSDTSSTSRIAKVNIGASAKVGAHTVTFKNTVGKTTTFTFTVTTGATGVVNIGTVVLAQWKSNPNAWGPAEVLKVNTDGTYNVKFKDDGTERDNWTKDKIAAMDVHPTTLKSGYIYVAKLGWKDEWYTALGAEDGSAGVAKLLFLNAASNMLPQDATNIFVPLSGLKESGNFIDSNNLVGPADEGAGWTIQFVE